jgi:hypothetical protein
MIRLVAVDAGDECRLERLISLLSWRVSRWRHRCTVSDVESTQRVCNRWQYVRE